MLGAGKSPHVLYRPEEIDVDLDSVKGAGIIREEIERTLELFLHNETFERQMGGQPRRGVLFEGPPGTGKTHMAKAMAREAGVPFMFVSSSAFQSMYYGQTNRKLRSYFRALRKAARSEGGAIGFIEEIDAIGGSRQGMGGKGEGVSGVVNELLIQLQSFDEPTRGKRLLGSLAEVVNNFLPAGKRLRKPRTRPANVLVLAATNRADDLDPALLRPGRFDRIVHFGLPGLADRRELLEFFISRRAHSAELEDPEVLDALSALMSGYSPVAIEHVFDEALIWALRRGAGRMDLIDVHKARLTEELGLTQNVDYEDDERKRIATHEAGHATMAWVVSQPDNVSGDTIGIMRRLEVLSIIKRRDSLGLLAHADDGERFTRTERELRGLLQISLGGLVAEELWFDQISTGPAGDLIHATNIAGSMVGTMGMGSSLVSFANAAGDGTSPLIVALSDPKTREEIEEVLDEAKAVVTEALRSNVHILEALRDALVSRQELVGPEIVDVIERAVAGHASVGADAIDLRSEIVS
jgi:cell division protease FtsH